MVEKYTVERLQCSIAKVAISISGETTADEYQKIIQKYAKTIEIKGFRKGKVPQALIEKKFGKELRSEAFQELLGQSTQELLPSIEPSPLPYAKPYIAAADGQPSSEAEKELVDRFLPGEPLDFMVAYDIAPEISQPSLLGLELDSVSVEIGEEDVQQQLKQLQLENAIMVEKKDKLAEEGDIVKLDFGVLQEGEETAEDLSFTTLLIGDENTYGFEDVVKTLKSGDETIIEEHAFPSTEQIEEHLRGKVARVWLKVTSIRTKELPDLDDDFAQDMAEEHETLEELKASIKKRLEHSTQHEIDNYHLFQIYRHWAEQLDFVIPQSMAQLQIQSVLEDIKTRMGGEEQGLMMYLSMRYGGDPQKGFEAIQAEALTGLFIDLVRKEVLESRALEVSEAEIETELAHMAQHHDMTVEQLRQRYKDRSTELEEQLKRSALSAKLTKELIAESSAKPEAVSLEELHKRLSPAKEACEEIISKKFSPFAAQPESLPESPESPESP